MAQPKRLIVHAWRWMSILSLLVFTTAAAAYGGSLWWTSTDFGEGLDGAEGVAIQSNGKIVLVGHTHHSANVDFAIARYNTNGISDTTFSGDGKQITNFGGTDRAYDLAVQSDGKIVVAGETCNNGLCNVALARYKPGGALDTTFSRDGKVVTDIGGRKNGASAVALQPDGKIVVVGYAWNGTDSDFAFYRYNPNGSRDATFSGDGIAVGHFGAGRSDFGYDLAIQSNGKIVGVGYTIGSAGSNFAMVRLNANGTLDPTFGKGGLRITDFGGDDVAEGVALQSDGKILVAGYKSLGDSSFLAVARYNPNGSLDTTFNGTGKKAFNMQPGFVSYGFDVMVQPNGKIVLVGETEDPPLVFDIALARLNPNGSLDTTFSGDGKLTINLCSDSIDAGTALVRQPSDGRYVIAGFTECNAFGGFDFVLARLLP